MTPDEIMQGFRNGNRDAIIHVFKTLLPNIRALLKKDNANNQAEYFIWIGIEIFEKKCQDPNFSTTDSPIAYIYKICKHKWIDEMGKRKSRKLNLSIDDPSFNGDTLPFIPADTDVPSYEELSQCVAACLPMLNKTCQNLLNLLHETSDLKEIAEQLDITYENVRYRKSVCLAALRKLVEKHKYFF